MLQVRWWSLRETTATMGMWNSLGRMERERSNSSAKNRLTVSATLGDSMLTGLIVGFECHQITAVSHSIISSRPLSGAPSKSWPAAILAYGIGAILGNEEKGLPWIVLFWL